MARVRCALALLLALAVAGGASAQLFPAGTALPTWADLFGADEVPNPLPKNAYRGTYGHTTCNSDVLVRPSSTEELASAVTSLVARAASEGRPLKMRATRDGFASIPSFPCATQPSDPKPFAAYPKPPLVAGLLLQNMNKVLAVDAEKRQMTVQAQMTLKEFYTAATAANLSIPRASLPWWQGLTLAGVMATTSHGTGLNVTSMICDWLVEVTWVDGKGAVHTSPAGSDEARGLCGGIGIVGVISELKLQMTPTSTTHVSTWYVKDDKDIANDINKMLAITPHLVVMWRPDIGKYTGHMQRPASPNATVIKDGACNVIPQFAPLVARMLGPGLRAWQNDYANREVVSYATSGDSFICAAALTNAVGAPWITKPGPLTATLGISQPVLDGVVYTNKATSTDCGDRCAWLTKSFQGTALDVEFAFEKKDLASFIADIKALIAKDLKGVPGMHNNGRCLLPGYYVLRFGRAPESHVGMAAGLSEPVYVQQQMLASRNTPGVPTRYEWVQETYEQLMLCKYNGRPHWAKNFDRTFTNPKCPMAAKHPAGFAAMAALQDKHDPERVYEPELWARMLKGDQFFLKPKCALDRSCYCEADEHCADGYACVPSAAFPQFNQCRPKVMN